MEGESPSTERPRWLREAVGRADGRGVRIAVIDSGQDPQWQDPRILSGIGLAAPERPFELSPSDDAVDRLGHGTACTDVILGLAPGVEILPIRVFGDRLETSPDLLLRALEVALEGQAQIANLSLGTRVREAHLPLFEATKLVDGFGMLMVSALPDLSAPSFPGAFPHVFGVSAGRFPNVHDFLFRSQGPADCLAQGERRVRWLGGEHRVTAGSSLAAPHISALLALFLEKNPGADRAAARDFLSTHSLERRLGVEAPEGALKVPGLGREVRPGSGPGSRSGGEARKGG